MRPNPNPNLRQRPNFVVNQRAKLVPKGFALVVTLSLMILLTLIAVGLLSLSAISMRTASQGEAMASARANARVALMLALGDLQKTLGPDRAISATSGIISDKPGKPNLTGSWESWDFNPAAAPDYDGEHADRFQNWLVSTPNPDDLLDRDFPSSAWSGETVDLVADGALGGDAPATARATAGLVPVAKSGTVGGAYAWHVADEGVKARINLYRDPDKENSLREMRGLLAGQRPDPGLINGVNGRSLDFLPTDETRSDYGNAAETVGKVTDLEQVSLLTNSANIRPFRNDVTPYATGVMADVRAGGLKRDLSTALALGTSLPEEFKGGNANVYQSTTGVTGPSDPYWTMLSSYYNLHADIDTAETAPTYYQRQPTNISASTLNPQTRYFPGPVIAKVEALMTYVTRDAHENWKGTLKGVDPKMLYMGHLMYTPLVTLHNPYNISISFDEFEVTIDGVPIGFRMFMNNSPQSQRLVPLNEMFVYDSQRSKGKKFVVRIANWRNPSSSSTSGPITMKPGQTLICSPYLDPRSSFDNKISDFFDWRNDLTDIQVKAIPGFNGPCIGFDIDWTTPTHQPYDTNPTSQFDKQGVFGLRATDSVRMEFGLVQPRAGSTGEFTVEAKLKSRGAERRYGGLTFRYSNQATLDKILLADQIYKYPADGSSFRALDAYAPNSDPISRHARAKTLAVFSSYARTTNGGVYETNMRTQTNGAVNALRDGQLAGKPYLFHNPARNVVRIDLENEKPGAQSHEMNFQPFISDKEYENYFFIDSSNRTPAITGNSTLKGVKSGTY
ncbi:MAG: pilus assembly PilX N-terminal domain-containing protein, partial [Verrucomicrobiae bacterium]|nr:pilus assembly PilX N-terminal domain-containing protein [Verrucomicrobiae bacterium]